MRHWKSLRLWSACCALLGASFATALGQISVTGVAHKGIYADTATFTIASQAGFTYTAFLNTNPVPVGVPVTVSRPDFYQLYVTRHDGVTTNATTLLFIIRASARGSTEVGLPAFTPWPVIPSSPAEFAGARLRVLAPGAFPAGYDIPVVAWVLDAGDRAVRANGLLAAPGQNGIPLKRGVGSGFLASNNPAGLLNYAPAVGGVATNKPITIESGTAWTTVSGTLAGATTWPDNSRIRVTGHLAIPAGSTLTIGAGTIVLLNAGLNITNDGAVLVNGTVEQPVVFMPNSRSQPWGGFFMRTSTGSINASGTIFVASGADPNGGAGHRSEQCLFLVDNAPSVTLTDSAAIYLAGQFGHAYSGGTFTFTRFLLQRATTGGEYTGSTWRVNDSAFIEFPDDSANFVDGDNDALYFVSTPASGGINFTNTLFGWTKDDGIDSGGSGYGPLRYQDCWFEATFHEGNSLSGYKDTRAWDTVYINCGQGLEDGYDGPTGRVERCLFTACLSGLRHGDNYTTFSGYAGLLTATNCLALFNHRDLFGYNWDDQGGWTNNWGRFLAGNNLLTRPDTNFPANAAWNPASDGWRLGAFGGKGRVGVALAVRPGQSTLASFPNGVPVGLSVFCTNEVTVDYSIDGTDGTHQAGLLRFVPGQTQHYIPVPGTSTGVLRVALSNPINADLTGASELLFQNYVPPGGVATVLSPLGAAWKYLDNGSEQGTPWRASGFDDSTWSNGVARLGFGSDPAPLTTTIRRYISGTSGPQVTNFYFRRTFTVEEPGAFAIVQFRYQRDDGCIVYLNGSQIFTNNMPPPPYTARTFSATTVSDSAEALAFRTNNFPASILQPGPNVLAVEVHQASGTSSDIGWEMQVLGLPAPPPPRVEISRLGGQPVIYWADPAFTLEQTAQLPATNWSSAGATSPVSVPPTEPLRLFRLKR